MQTSKKARRRIAVFVAAVLALALIPATAFAADGTRETLQDVAGGTVTAATTQQQLETIFGAGGATITANSDGTATVQLQKDIVLAQYKNITFGNYASGASQPRIIFDLNGCTISSTSITIANVGNLTIRDTSAEKTGAVVYNGGQYMVAVNNVGYSMQIEGGTFTCNGAGSASYNAAISTADASTTQIDGGTFEGGAAGAVISNGKTIVNGGTFTGGYGFVAKVSSSGVEGSVVFPEGSDASVTGSNAAFYRIEGTGANAGKAGSFTVGGGQFDAPVIVKEKTDTLASTTTITGGTFAAEPTAYVPASNALAGYTPAGSDKTAYIVGAQKIAQQAASATAGDKLEVLSGDVDLSVRVEGVTITNTGAGSVQVNGQQVPQGDDVVTHIHQLQKTEAKSATCTADGNTAYWHCSGCGKYFSDENGAVEIALKNTVVKATGHQVTEIRGAKEATCTAEGYTGDTVCVACGEILERGLVVAKIPHSYQNGKCTVCGTAAPTEPEAPKTNPQTGDSSLHFIALLLLAGAAGAGVCFAKKKYSA
nr:hypothetical protein [Maliibacterium massiliense]